MSHVSHGASSHSRGVMLQHVHIEPPPPGPPVQAAAPQAESPASTLPEMLTSLPATAGAFTVTTAAPEAACASSAAGGKARYAAMPSAATARMIPATERERRENREDIA